MWEARRWGTFPEDRLVVLIEGIRAAGHDVQKIVNGKPIVSTLSDADLELAAQASRPGHPPQVPGLPARGRSKRGSINKASLTKKPRGRPRKTSKKGK